MFPFLGGLIGAAGSLFGGLMNTSSQQAINSANLAQQMYLANNSVSMRVADANRAGINPLAALGVSSPGFVGATATDPGAGVAAAGQSIERALTSQQDKEDKLDSMKAALLQAQIDETNANTTGRMLLNSKLARLATGSPPVGVGSEVFGPRRDAMEPGDPSPNLYTDYLDRAGGRMTLLSPEAQRSVFSGVPTMPLNPVLAAGLVGANARNVLSDPVSDVGGSAISRWLGPGVGVFGNEMATSP